MKIVLTVVIAAVVSGIAFWTDAVSVAPDVANAADKDCADFKNQAEAQEFYESQGPGDPHRLDADGDGVACESNPCPCSDGGGSQPPEPSETKTTRKLCGKFVGVRASRVCLKATTKNGKLRHVKGFRFKRLPAKCDDGTRPRVSGGRRKIGGEGRRFRSRRLNIRGGFSAVRATAEGKVKGESEKAVGTVRVRFKNGSGARCDTGLRKWKAG